MEGSTTARWRAIANKPVSALLMMASILAMTLLVAAPVSAQQYAGETVEVAFELTIDGEVPEGRVLSLSLPNIADLSASPFCSTASTPPIPQCEDGATYTTTFRGLGGSPTGTPTITVGAGSPLYYEYQVRSVDGTLLETFAADTITPTQDTTVSVTYHAAGTPVTPDQGVVTPDQGVVTPDKGAQVLPDTGGTSLLLPAAALLLVAGLIGLGLVRRS